MKTRIKARAPATLSNLNCGFDVLGLAVNLWNDEIIARRTGKPGVQLILRGSEAKQTPADPRRNTASVASRHYLDYIGATKEGVELEIHKSLRPGSGLGSSASSACAAVVATNAVFGNPLAKSQLLPFAVLGEYAADRSWHADNVAPCLLGGMILIRDLMQLDVHRVYLPAGLHLVAVFPEIRVLTSEARGVLSASVSMQQLIRQTAHLGSLLLALEHSDFKLFADAMQDYVITPQRAHLIPGFEAVRKAAFLSGALSCGISGAGPTVFAFTDNRKTAEASAAEMQNAFQDAGVTSEAYVTTVQSGGTEIC